ncbi:condensation domain-containing protein [Paracoccus sp. KR1-242]|uniref:condensation domain-containing protein n=1 Tax=Paracoccus sp. KR1-242 TaxID=3410028 RepID=UPI003C052FD4
MTQQTISPTQQLTLAQLDFWEEFRLHPGEAVSTVAHAIEFTGPTDPDALARAIGRTIAETDVLALRFDDGPNGPRQGLDLARRPALRLIDLSGHRQPREHAFAMMQADVAAPLDLARQPLSAQWLLRLGPEHLIWFNRGHHIVLDGYAMGMIEARAARLYAFETGSGDPGQPLGRFADYLAEEAGYRASSRHVADGRHWQAVLTACPPPRVLTKGSENYPAEDLSHEQSLEDLQADLLARSAEWGMGWPDLLTVLCAAWAALHLQDASAERRDDAGQIVMPVWLPYLSRMGSVAIGVPALVVNILPFRAALEPAEPLGPAVTRLCGELRKLRRHGRYRIEQIAADHGLGQSERFFFSPLINILPFDPANFPGCTTQRHVLSNGPGDGFNITIRADSAAGGMQLLLGADPTLTPPADFARHRRSLPQFLRDALRAGAANRAIASLLPRFETA